MKTKLLMFFMAIGMLLTLPSLSYAQGYTDEDIDFQGGDAGNSDFGPVSLDPILIKGIVSHENQTLQLNFQFDLQTVTVWIVDENGTLYLSEEINTSVEATKTLNLKALPAKKYKIICFTPEGKQVANFELHK